MKHSSFSGKQTAGSCSISVDPDFRDTAVPESCAADFIRSFLTDRSKKGINNLSDIVLSVAATRKIEQIYLTEDGFSLMEHLKNDPELRKIPVIFLTGMTDTDDEIRGLTLGGADYIRKPFHREVLLARIAVQLAARSRQSQQIPEDIASLLTENERNVAELLRQGYSGKEIGENLFFSYSYIKRIIASVKVKLEVDSTTELIRKLRESH